MKHEDEDMTTEISQESSNATTQEDLDMTGDLFEEIEDILLKEGLVPKTVTLSTGESADFWCDTEELYIDGEVADVPYFDPMGLTDDEVRAKLNGASADTAPPRID